jgi:hypothetical protein
MKKKWYTILALFCILTVAVVFTIILPALTNTNEEKNNVKFLPVPFGGYVCGYENKETFLQLPLLLRGDNELSIEDISSVTLLSNKAELLCNISNILPPINDNKYDYNLSTLTFLVKLPLTGEYSIDGGRVTMHDGNVNSYKLSKLVFDVRKAEGADTEISMRQFMINQEDYKTFRVAYQNNTDDTVELIGLAYPKSMYKGQTINKYLDFNLTTPEDGLDIPAGEERTFLFCLDPESRYFSGENSFLYMLPFVTYSVHGVTKSMPSQTQATVVQSPFTPEYVMQLFEDNGIE